MSRVTAKPKTIKDVVIKFDDLVDLDLPPIDYIVYPAIREKSVTQIFGIRESYKTLFTQAVAASACLGKPFVNGWRVEREHKVLYVDGELPQKDIVDRFQTFHKGPIENLTIYPNDAILDGPVASLTNEEWRNEFTEFAREEKFELVIFDNISSLAYGLKENAKEEWAPIIGLFLSLKKLNITPVFIHHAGKTKGLFSRGHSGLEDCIEVSILLRKSKGANIKGTPDVLLEFPKYRMGIDPKLRMPKRYVLENGIWKDEDLENEEKMKMIVTFLEMGWSQKTIEDATGIAQPKISRRVKDLKGRGILDSGGRITDAGKDWLYEEE